MRHWPGLLLEQRRLGPRAILQGHWRPCPLQSQVALLVAVILLQPGSWPATAVPSPCPIPRQGEVLASGRGFLTGPGRWWEQASQVPSLSSDPGTWVPPHLAVQVSLDVSLDREPGAAMGSCRLSGGRMGALGSPSEGKGRRGKVLPPFNSSISTWF